MSSLNATRKSVPVYTAEGARGFKGNHEQQLRRLALCCMLWEDNFYIDGQKVADLIAELIHKTPMAKVAEIAIEAREQSKLRHLPLLLVSELARHPALTKSPRVVSETLARVIQRPDELTEFLAIYWKDGKCPLSKQVKLGSGKAEQDAQGTHRRSRSRERHAVIDSRSTFRKAAACLRLFFGQRTRRAR